MWQLSGTEAQTRDLRSVVQDWATPASSLSKDNPVVVVAAVVVILSLPPQRQLKTYYFLLLSVIFIVVILLLHVYFILFFWFLLSLESRASFCSQQLSWSLILWNAIRKPKWTGNREPGLQIRVAVATAARGTTSGSFVTLSAKCTIELENQCSGGRETAVHLLVSLYVSLFSFSLFLSPNNIVHDLAKHLRLPLSKRCVWVCAGIKAQGTDLTQRQRRLSVCVGVPLVVFDAAVRKNLNFLRDTKPLCGNITSTAS